MACGELRWRRSAAARRAGAREVGPASALHTIQPTEKSASHATEEVTKLPISPPQRSASTTALKTTENRTGLLRGIHERYPSRHDVTRALQSQAICQNIATEHKQPGDMLVTLD